MNQSEYEALLKLRPADEINVNELKDKTPRTLLLGMADPKFPTRTMHVYLSPKQNLVSFVVDTKENRLYSFASGKSLKISDCDAYSLTPGYSDFEFSALLLQAGARCKLSPFDQNAYEMGQTVIKKGPTLGGYYQYPIVTTFMTAIPEVQELLKMEMALTADDFGLGEKLRSAELVERLNGILNLEIERLMPLNDTYSSGVSPESVVAQVPDKISKFVARYFELDSWQMPNAAAERLKDVAFGIQARRRGELNRIFMIHDV